MKKVKVSELKRGDRFAFKIDLNNRKTFIVESIDRNLKYYESTDTGRYKKFKIHKDLKDTVTLLNR